MDTSKAEKFTLQYHSANPNMCRIPELKIKQLDECNGGGWCMRREQAEEIVAAVNAYDPAREAAFEAMRGAAENVVIAFGMGWDMNGVVAVLKSALANGEG